MLSLIWLVFKGVRACAFTIVVYIARVRTKSPKCIIRFIYRYVSYTNSIDSLNKINNIHIPPKRKKDQYEENKIRKASKPTFDIHLIFFAIKGSDKIFVINSDSPRVKVVPTQIGIKFQLKHKGQYN